MHTYNKERYSQGGVVISHIDEEKNIEIAFEKPITELVIDEKTEVWNLEKENKDASRHKDLHVFGDFCYISKGMVLNADEKTAKGKFKKDDLISEIYDEIHCRKYIEAKDFSRYSINRVRYLEYGTKRSPKLLSRATFEQWFCIPKVYINRIGNLQATLNIENQIIHNDSISVKRYSHHSREEMEELSKKVNLYYLLAILNSKYASHLLSIQRGGLSIYPEHIRNLPIPIASPSDMQALSEYAKQELTLHQKLKEAKLPQDKTVIENGIKVLDSKIDMLVYKIYGVKGDET